MEADKQKTKQFYELKAVKKDPRAVGIVLLKNLTMVGRSINCDLCINKKEVANIHAVVELKRGKGLIHDMNSKTGTFVNGERISGSSEFKIGDVLGFGGIDFEFTVYHSDDDSRYKLDILTPEKSATLFPEKGTSINNESGEDFPFITGDDNFITGEEDPPDLPPGPPRAKYAAYPLAKDKKAEFSEYIFEDINEVYPIFDYSPQKACVEVIILYMDSLLSVDYLPENNGKFYLSGYKPKLFEVEYPPLGKSKRSLLLEVDGKIIVHPLNGFSMLYLQDAETKVLETELENTPAHVEKGTVELKASGIVRFSQDDIQIYIRRVDAPPEVKPPPFLSRDKTLYRKYLAPVMGAAFLIFLILFFGVEVKEEDKEEKNIKRLAKILKPRTIQKVSNKSKSEEKTKVNESKTDKPTKKKEKTITTAENKPKQQQRKKQAAKKSAQKPSKEKPKQAPSYQPVNFSSSLKSLLSKSKAASKASINKKAADSNYLGSTGSIAGANAGGSIKRAKVSNKVGSLAGIASGKIDSSTSAKGLSNKGTTMIADIPTRTIVRGAIDPDIIRALLREHLPQFRHCYQKELERGGKNRFEGVAKLDFRIGASGRVTKSKTGVKVTNSPMPKCIDNIVLGIQFPVPKGGGVVDVKQTINFNIGN